MESRTLQVSIAVLLLSALASTNSQKIPGESYQWTTPATGLNLDTKMITVSAKKGPVSFYPPYYSLDSAIEPYTQLPDPPRQYPTRPYYPTRQYPTRPYYPTRQYPTRPYYPTRQYPTRHYPTRPYWTTPYPWTTESPTAGVSVCVSYMTDDQQSLQTLFLLSKSSSSALRVGVSDAGYLLTFGAYRANRLLLKPYIDYFLNIRDDIWTRLCITVDSVKNVVQVFSGPRMSIRKRLSAPYFWKGEPVIDFFSFDGQVTGVQIWDYPLRYREISQYMDPSTYGLYTGNVLSWSYISYSPSGNALLENCYEWLEKKSTVKGKGKKWQQKKTKKIYDRGERKKQPL